MSRRKQANPRSVQVFEGKNGPEEDIKLIQEKHPQMEAIRPLNVDINLPYPYPIPSSLSEESLSRVASPCENPSMMTSPSTPSSTCSSLTTSDLPLPKLKDASKILPVPGSDGRAKYVCPMCQEQLESNHDFTVHIRMHNAGNQMSQNNTCTICNKILSSQSSLDRHMLVHSGERPFRCKICDMSFTTNGNMHRHSRIHKKNGTTGAETTRTNRRGSKSWKLKPISSSSIDETDMSPNLKRTLGTDQSKKLSKSLPGAVDWTKDYSKQHILPKGKMMPAYMPRPMWPTYSPYMPFMRPQFPPVFPDLSMSMFPFQQQLPCPLCCKMINLVEYMTHLKSEHEHENPFLPSKTPDSTLEMSPMKKEPTEERETKSPNQFIEVVKDIKTENQESDESEVSSTSSPKNGSKGFKDLNLIDFSSPKFPLIAKTWCEKNDSDASRDPQDFNCKDCGKIFPCKSSLLLHAESHQESRSFETIEAEIDETVSGKVEKKSKKGFFSMLNLKPNQMEATSTDDISDVSIKIEKTLDDQEAFDDHEFNASDNPQEGKSDIGGLTYLKPSCMPFNVSNLSLNVQRGLLHADSPLAVSTSPASSVLSGDGTGSCGEMHDGKATGLLCKFCDMVFPNQKSLNAHKRIHLGLSPYKCSMCNYSSADKSTLIRHFRTHNGERPFQCIICDYAFTTKANCERHVRKKHGKHDKSEIENSIGYNKYTTTDLHQLNTFNSPDTVCKYCGEDFKFFRALKHHLRSHSSCRLKPFLCQKCQIGFSTKANCVRHIQKQHVEVDMSEVEQYIQVNEPGTLGDNDSDSSTSDNTSYSQHEPINVPPKAHASTPMDLSPVAGHHLLKQMMVHRDSSSLTSHHLNYNHMDTTTASIDSSLDNEEPMDLSVKKEITTPDDKKTTPKQTEISPNMNYQCPYCLRSFTVRAELGLHVQQVHDITPEKDTNNNRKWLPETATPRKLPIMPYPIHPAFVNKYRYPGPAISALFSPGGFDMSTDLSPVNRMLTAAHSQNFKPFLTQSTDHVINPIATSSLDNDDDGCDSDVFSEDNFQEKNDPYKFEPIPGIDNSESKETKLEFSDPIIKKKRNSYADSPHKLNCPYCPRSFPWVSSLNRHLLTHTGQKPFKCSQCPVTFSTKSNRERHLIRKHGVNMLDPASRSTMDRPYKCHLCVFSSFATKSNLLKHYTERHPGSSLPDRWDEITIDLDQTSDKMDVTSTNDNIEDEYLDEKEERDPSDTELGNNDYIVIDPTDIEPTNEQSPSDEEEMMNTFDETPEKHVNPERDNYNVDKIRHCWKCSEEFTSRKLLVRHLKEHNIDLPYKCYLCDASFDTRLECLQHKEKMHQNDWLVLFEKNGVKNIEEFSNQIDKMVCKSSSVDVDGENKDSNTLEMLESARADVLAADYFQRKVYCSLCPKRFWSLQDLRRHMRSHTGERPFECDICYKRFTLKHSMMRHRRKHGNVITDTSLFTNDTENLYNDEQSEGTQQFPRLPEITYNTTGSKPTNDTGSDDNASDVESSDMLHNLLGVNNSDIDTMLDLKNSLDSTTQLLGMEDK